MEAVAAEQEAVALLDVEDARVDLDVVPVAHRARDDVAVGRLVRLLRRDEPLPELPRDEGVVLGHLRRRLPTHQVDAAVADLAEDGVLAQHEHRADGGSHARLVLVELGHGEDHVGRRLDGAFEHAARGPDALFRGLPAELGHRLEAALHHPVDGLDGLLARHLAGRVAAHAVGNDVETQAVVRHEGVLVHRTSLPDVRPGVGLGDEHARPRSVDEPSRGLGDFLARGLRPTARVGNNDGERRGEATPTS